jgi:hypothetical protein
VQVVAVSPERTSRVLRRCAPHNGFSVTSDTVHDVDMLAPHGVHEVHGWFFAERKLEEDRKRTHRRDTARWVAVGMGAPIGGWVWCVVLVGTPNAVFTLLGDLGAIEGGFASAIAGWSFASSDFSSDLVAVSYSTEMSAAGSSLPIADRAGSYLVRVTVARGLSQNFVGQYGSGRNVLRLAEEPELDRLREDLVAVLTDPTVEPSPPDSPGAPLPG